MVRAMGGIFKFCNEVVLVLVFEVVVKLISVLFSLMLQFYVGYFCYFLLFLLFINYV